MSLTVRKLVFAAAAMIVTSPTLVVSQTRGSFFFTDASSVSRLQINTTTGNVDLSAAFRGWYNSDGANNGRGAAANYAAGRCDVNPPCASSAVTVRNWFQFNLANVTGRTITGATLFLDNPAGNGFLSVNPSETYSLFDITTSLNTLGTATGVSIYDDLGTGTSFGSRSMSSADNGTSVAMALNSAALTALSGAQGANFGVGGAIALATTVPEPSTYAMLVAGLSMIGIAAKRRRNA